MCHNELRMNSECPKIHHSGNLFWWRVLNFLGFSEFFVNKDLGGPYWDPANLKSYTSFNPIENVDKWNTPILVIQGGKDYRVPVGQGLEAFQAAQLRGIKSKLMYLPDENHWVLSPQNGIVWQNEFFKWLSETLN